MCDVFKICRHCHPEFNNDANVPLCRGCLYNLMVKLKELDVFGLPKEAIKIDEEDYNEYAADY